jgi:hypothetical protein
VTVVLFSKRDLTYGSDLSADARVAFWFVCRHAFTRWSSSCAFSRVRTLLQNAVPGSGFSMPCEWKRLPGHGVDKEALAERQAGGDAAYNKTHG